jgi:hypothetical protein
MLAVVVAALTCPAGCAAPLQERNAHPALLEYKAGVKTDAQQARVDDIDMSETATADPVALAHLASDRAARLFAPMALECAGLSPLAVKLRALPPIIDGAAAKRVLETPDLRLGRALVLAAAGAPVGGGALVRSTELTMMAAAGSLAKALAASRAGLPAARTEEARRALKLAALAAGNARMAAALAFLDRIPRPGQQTSTAGRTPGPTVEAIDEAARALLLDLVAAARGKSVAALAPAPKAEKPAESTPASAEPCQQELGTQQYPICLARLIDAGRAGELLAVCKPALDDPANAKLAKLDACVLHAPAVLLHLGKEAEATEGARKSCAIRRAGVSGPPSRVRESLTTLAAGMACMTAAANTRRPGQPNKSFAKQLGSAAAHFARACGLDRQLVTARARAMCRVTDRKD